MTIGKVFTRLTVIEWDSIVKKWRCRCECGSEIVVRAADLNSGNTKSCGCYKMDVLLNRSVTHSHTKGVGYTPEYNAWCHIKSRCTNENVWNYDNYGGRGIKMCERWLNSFENFFSDMGFRPSPKHSIDRYPDINGDYTPENCRWADKHQQSRGQRTNHWLEYKGERMVLTDWAMELKSYPANINRMLNKKSFPEIVEYYKKRNNA